VTTTFLKSSLTFSILTRSSSAMRGVSPVRTVRMTLRSCSTLLCLRLCIRATGVMSGSEVRKIAVPGARCGARARRISIRSTRGTLSRRVLAVRICEPRTQVAMIRNSAAPISTGSQPPVKKRKALADRKVRSSVMNGTKKHRATGRLQFHIFRMTMKAMQVVTHMVPVTARP
jgi:hypothetical protein